MDTYQQKPVYTRASVQVNVTRVVLLTRDVSEYTRKL